MHRVSWNVHSNNMKEAVNSSNDIESNLDPMLKNAHPLGFP